MLTLPITPSMLETAQKLAAIQSLPFRQAQVLNNCLAVMVVKSYLQMMEIETHLQSADCWHYITRQFSNAADLPIIGKGRLECRTFHSPDNTCSVPVEIADDCIGLIGLKLEHSKHQAHLLGFTSTVIPGSVVSLQQLHPLEDMLDYFESLVPKAASLTQWFDGLFESGWQTVDTLVGNSRWCLALGFMSEPIQLQTPIAGAKLIDLGIEMGSQSVVLLVAIAKLSEEKFEIRVQLHPTKDEPYLPTNLSLNLLSDTGVELREVISRQSDNLIQLPRFQCCHGETFGVQLKLDEVSVQEMFAI